MTIDTDLATLHDLLLTPPGRVGVTQGQDAYEALARVEAELSRLREERDAWVESYLERGRDLAAAEARCARLEEERDEYRIEADHGHDDLATLRRHLAHGVNVETGEPILLECESTRALARVEAVIEAARGIKPKPSVVDGTLLLSAAEYAALAAALAALDKRGET